MKIAQLSPVVLAILALALALGVTACAKDPPPAAQDEKSLRAQDRAALERVIALDVRTSQAMREADEGAVKGDAGAASEVLARRAAPSIDEALRLADGAVMKTAWGTAKKEALVGVIRERKAEMPRYEQAMKGADPEKMLEAISAQAAIERRAVAAVAAVQDER